MNPLYSFLEQPRFYFLTFFVMLTVAVLMVRLFNATKQQQSEGDDPDSDDEGGVELFDPVLDLPPGVTLPVDEPDLVTE